MITGQTTFTTTDGSTGKVATATLMAQGYRVGVSHYGVPLANKQTLQNNNRAVNVLDMSLQLQGSRNVA